MKTQGGYEIFISIMLFIFAIIYIFYEMVSYYQFYLREREKEILFSEAYQISQILVNDGGEPPDWFNNIFAAKRIGLLNESYNTQNLLSLRKVRAFNNSCNANYQLVKRLIGTNYNFTIVLRLSNGTTLINCTTLGGENIVKISRVVSLDDFKSYGELILWVY